MATYSSSLQAVHRPSAPAPYLVSNTIDIAVENTNNAAALAANDILQIRRNYFLAHCPDRPGIVCIMCSAFFPPQNWG